MFRTLWCICAALLLCAGCDIRRADAPMCGALHDHLVRTQATATTAALLESDAGVAVRDAAGDEAAAQGAAVVGEGLAWLAHQASDRSGSRGRFVDRCQTTMKRYQVRRCLADEGPADEDCRP